MTSSEHGSSVEIRRLDAGDVGLLGEIDRSEQLDMIYQVVGGELVASPTDFFVPRWSTTDDGDHSVAHIVRFAAPIVERGATFLGAYRGGELVGLMVVEGDYRPNVAWFALLHVSRQARRSGAASALWAAAEKVARGAGATKLYVSSAPTGSAVGFYFSRGCRLATKSEIIQELFELEPEDTHLVCELGDSPVRATAG